MILCYVFNFDSYFRFILDNIMGVLVFLLDKMGRRKVGIGRHAGRKRGCDRKKSKMNTPKKSNISKP